MADSIDLRDPWAGPMVNAVMSGVIEVRLAATNATANIRVAGTRTDDSVNAHACVSCGLVTLARGFEVKPCAAGHQGAMVFVGVEERTDG